MAKIHLGHETQQHPCGTISTKDSLETEKVMEGCKEKAATAARISAASQHPESTEKAATACWEHTWCHGNYARLPSPEQASSERVQKKYVKKAFVSRALCCLDDGSYYPSTRNIKKII